MYVAIPMFLLLPGHLILLGPLDLYVYHAAGGFYMDR